MNTSILTERASKEQTGESVNSLAVKTTAPVVEGKPNQKPAVPSNLATTDQVNDALSQLFTDTKSSPISGALVPWLAGELSPRSRKDYLVALRDFSKAMSDHGVALLDVDASHIRLYKAAMLQAGLRPATISQSLSAIRGMYRQLGQSHLVPWNVVADIQSVRSPKVEKNQTPGLSYDQACALLSAPDTATIIGLRDQALLFTYFFTAVRATALTNAKAGGLRQVDGLWQQNGDRSSCWQVGRFV